MKDEEMAEEYKVDYGIDLCCLCRECEIENINPCQHKKDAMYGYKDGFLAGLKAGRPQWHDIRKDKNDLPKECKNVLINALDYGINTCYVAHRLNGKWRSNCSSETFVRVLAWCEIPTFDKE